MKQYCLLHDFRYGMALYRRTKNDTKRYRHLKDLTSTGVKLKWTAVLNTDILDPGITTPTGVIWTRVLNTDILDPGITQYYESDDLEELYQQAALLALEYE